MQKGWRQADRMAAGRQTGDRAEMLAAGRQFGGRRTDWGVRRKAGGRQTGWRQEDRLALAGRQTGCLQAGLRQEDWLAACRLAGRYIGWRQANGAQEHMLAAGRKSMVRKADRPIGYPYELTHKHFENHKRTNRKF
jgi:hypothetical protein